MAWENKPTVAGTGRSLALQEFILTGTEAVFRDFENFTHHSFYEERSLLGFFANQAKLRADGKKSREIQGLAVLTVKQGQDELQSREISQSGFDAFFTSAIICWEAEILLKWAQLNRLERNFPFRQK